MEEPPEELDKLDSLLSETYFCNFSLFQSMPDSWAVKQLFPVMPIHRLNEEPRHQAIIGDITCDSDGKIDRFIDRRDVSRTLPLHTFDGSPYYLAAFLVGAYQEILGDMHNLFGDTNAVHVSIEHDGQASIETVVQGDTVREVLHYVQFDADSLFSACSRRSKAPSAPIASTTARPANSFASTKPDWKATPISKNPTKSSILSRLAYSMNEPLTTEGQICRPLARPSLHSKCKHQ